MLRLNHANLPTHDPAALTEFFTQHFGFEALVVRGNHGFVVMKGLDGFILNVMRAPSGDRTTLHPPADDDALAASAPDPTSALYPKGFHVGFLVETPDEVYAKHAEMQAARRDVGAVEDLNRGGYASITFYCNAPGGILVEVSSPAPAAA